MSQEKQTDGAGFDVGYVAHLARLELGEAERAQLQGQLEHILQYVEELKKVDIEGVAPMASSLSEAQALRPDEIRPGLDNETVLQNAPASRQGQFLVPAILE